MEGAEAVIFRATKAVLKCIMCGKFKRAMVFQNVYGAWSHRDRVCCGDTMEVMGRYGPLEETTALVTWAERKR